MLLLDLTWLVLVARGLYKSALGSLERSEPYLPAAALFYAMYIAAVVIYAVLGSNSPFSAFRRGAGLGFVAYATYELTNWAVLRDWPVVLVPVDIGWGVVLTAVAGLMGKIVYARIFNRAR